MRPEDRTALVSVVGLLKPSATSATWLLSSSMPVVVFWIKAFLDFSAGAFLFLDP
jgi:hypothetical protein